MLEYCADIGPMETEKVLASWMTDRLRKTIQKSKIEKARGLVVTRSSYNSSSINLFPQTNIRMNGNSF